MLPYYEGLPVPPGYEVTSRPASGVITGGVVGLALSYGAGVIVGATQGFKNASGWLAVPIAGPWVAIAERGYPQCKTTNVGLAKACLKHAVAEVQFITFVAVDGVFQLASGLLTLAGLLSTRQELTRRDLVPKVTVSSTGPRPGDLALGLESRF